MTSNLQLILGGARSGKSSYAIAQGDEGNYQGLHFLATASPGDEEMKMRIKRHRTERDPRWKVVEEPYHLPSVLEKSPREGKNLIVVDCATLWISNLLCGMGGKALPPPGIEKEFEKFIKILKQHSGDIRIVSNEVGLGVVPDNALARQFQDLQGTLNKSLAVIATKVIFMTAGLPLKIK